MHTPELLPVWNIRAGRLSNPGYTPEFRATGMSHRGEQEAVWEPRKQDR